MWINYVNTGTRLCCSTPANYEQLLGAAEVRFRRTSREAISILHGFTYAAFYNLKDDVLTQQLAKDLYERTRILPKINDSVQWGLETQYFALSRRYLASSN